MDDSKIAFTGNPKILKWARRAARVDLSQAAQVAGRSDKVWRCYESGMFPADLIGVSTARSLAKLYKRPFAALFLSKVPLRWYFEVLRWPRRRSYEGGWHKCL